MRWFSRSETKTRRVTGSTWIPCTVKFEKDGKKITSWGKPSWDWKTRKDVPGVPNPPPPNYLVPPPTNVQLPWVCSNAEVGRAMTGAYRNKTNDVQEYLVLRCRGLLRDCEL